MEMPRFRARTVPELLDASFQVVRVIFWELCLVTLVITAPALVMQLVLAEEWRPFGVWLQNVLANYATAAAVLMVSDVYLGREASVVGALRRTFARFGSIFGAAFVRGFAIGIGILLCVVPGIIVMIFTFAMPMAVVLEGCGAMDSYERSKALAKDQWGRIVGAYLLAYLLAMLAAVGIGMAVTFAGGDTIGNLADMLAGVMLAPFVAVVGTLLYYDLRIRKEGFDIEMLVAEVNALGASEVPAG